ncbi:MAG: Ig-like domain-containing protein [Candidatus Hydrogenedentota bacterium]
MKRSYTLLLLVAIVAFGALPVAAVPNVQLYTPFLTQPPDSALRGTAAIPGDGRLHLTDATASQMGSFIWTPDRALPSLRAKADVLVGGGTGADGISFSYGGNFTGGAFGEWGTGNGVIVKFYTWSGSPPRVEVDYAGSQLLSMPVDQDAIRLNTFVPLEVNVEHDGQCIVKYNNVTYFDAALPGWNPMDDWQIGLGARTGGAHDNHHVNSLMVRGSTPYPVSLTRLDPSPVLAGTANVGYEAFFSEVVSNLDGNDFALTTVSGAPSTTINGTVANIGGAADNFDGGGTLGDIRGSAAYVNNRLQLTPAQNSQTGSWSFEQSEPLTAFRVTFDLFIGGGNGADGMAFAYGPGASTNFGNNGPNNTDGLVVSFDTYQNPDETPTRPAIDLKYYGVSLLGIPKTLRTASYVPVTINVSHEGMCTVIHDGTVTHKDLILPNWDPGENWHMGIGASTGGVNDIHAIDNFQLQTSAYQVQLDDPAGEGEIRLDQENASVNDLEGIGLNPASRNGDEAYVFDLVAPAVTDVQVQSGTTIDVTFSEAMGAGVTTATNYTVSGSGQGTLADNPDSVTLESGDTYRLTWPNTQEMFDGGDITVTVQNVQDAPGNGIGSPNNGTDAGGAIGEAPNGVCTDTTVNLSNPVLEPADIDGGSTDNVGITTSLVDGQSSITYACTDVGTPTVTLQVQDAAGNFDECDATVTVTDDLDPTAVCQPFTAELDSAGNASITAADVDDGSSDNCGIDTLSVSPDTFTCADIGNNTVTLTVTDVNGNTSTCDTTVTVEDSAPPVAACVPGITAELDSAGNASITAADVDDGSSDNCGVDTLSVSPDTFTCADIGDNTVTLTVTDVNGNVATCTATVTVEDNLAPTDVTVTNLTRQLDAAGTVTVDPNDVLVGAIDNCGLINASLDQDTFTCADLGDNAVTLTVEDGSGNITTQTATITIEDDIPPTVITKDIEVELDATGTATINAADIDGGSFDNCGIDTLTADVDTFDCGDIGDHTVTLTATDPSGNTASGIATVTVEDTIAPTVKTEDIVVELDETGYVAITAAQLDEGSSDNCSIASFAVSPDEFGCAAIGANTAALTVTDVNGNEATDDATVTVEDNLPPVVTPNAGAEQPVLINSEFEDPGATADDNCTEELEVEANCIDGDCEYDTGTHDNTWTIEYTATDGSANTGTATTVFTVDGVPPTIDLDTTAGDPVNGAITVDVTLSEPSTTFTKDSLTVNNATDPVSDFLGSGDTYSFTLEPKNNGVFSVSVAADTFTDIAGNLNEASEVLSITYDSTPPEIDSRTPSADSLIGGLDFVRVVFSEYVTGVAAGDLTVDGSPATSVTGSGAGPYEFTGFAAPGDGEVNVVLDAGDIADPAGNPFAGETWTYTVDSTLVSVTLTTDDVLEGAIVNSPSEFAFRAQFSRAVSGFEAADVAVNNGTVSDFSGSGAVYTFTVTPDADGLVSVLVPEQVATATAPDGDNLASEEISFTYDTTPPIITLVGGIAVEVDCGAGYSDPGVESAVDNIDGDVSADVVISGTTSLPSNTPPTVTPFEATYEVMDTAANTAALTRHIHVLENCPLDVFPLVSTEIFAELEESVRLEVGVSGEIGTVDYDWQYTAFDGETNDPITLDPGCVIEQDNELLINENGLNCSEPFILEATCTVSDDVAVAVSPEFVVYLGVGTGVPAAGGIALLALGVGCSLAGAVVLRRRHT